jgi:uncharacterized protein
MFEEILAIQNPHWTGKTYEKEVERDCFIKALDYLATGQVLAITGVRRAGKSTLAKQLINHLIEQMGVLPKNILFFNLEHPYLSPYREDSLLLQRLFEDYLKMNQPTGLIYAFLDEVQFFRQWPIFVKAHFETKKVRFVITGSNAIMLSSDMITLLSGRTLPLEVFPFSLKELALSRKIPHYDLALVAQKSSEIRHLLDLLLQYGGFPTVALRTSPQTAFDILGAYARTVLLQDVVPRLGARKPVDLEKLYVYLISNIGKLFSYLKLSKLFNLSDKSIKEYIDAFCDAHLIYEIDMFSFSLKQQIHNPKKIYSIDTGQANAMGFAFSANRGRLLENLIFIELKRLDLPVYYFKTKADHEIDFVLQQGSQIALVQVAWDINSSETYTRETRSLQDGLKELQAQSALIIVLEPVFSPQKAQGEIQIISAYQYLMLSEKQQKKVLFHNTAL